MSERTPCHEHEYFHGSCTACQRIRAGEAEARVRELGEFIAWLFGEWCPGGDIDGGGLQEEMERRGLIVPRLVTAQEANDESGRFSEWGEGDTIYVLVPELEVLRGEEER